MYIYIGLTTGGGPILGEHGDKIQNKKVCQADFRNVDFKRRH